MSNVEIKERQEMFEEDNQFFPEIMALDIDEPIVTREKSSKEKGYELGVLGIQNRVYKVRNEKEILNVIKSIDKMQVGINKFVLRLEKQKDCPAIENMMNLKIRLCALVEVALSELKAIQLEKSYLRILRKLMKDFGLTEEYLVKLTRDKNNISIINKIAKEFDISEQYWKQIKENTVRKNL